MEKTIIVAGHGPGISQAVARKFGAEGYRVALVARNGERLERAVEELTRAGVEARAFRADLGQREEARRAVREVRDALGHLTILHWNAIHGGAGDLLRAAAELPAVFDVGVHGLLEALQEALPDLRQHRGGVLVTGGGYGQNHPQVDAAAVEWSAMGLALCKATQHKLVGLLNKKLAAESVFAGEVMVKGVVKGTAYDRGHATIEPARVADAFWNLYSDRNEAYVAIS